MQSLLSRVGKGAAAILCGQAIIAVGNLALVPLYLERWAPTVYGEWVALMALSGYLATLDFGINMAVANRLTQAYARRDFEEYASCQHSALAYYLALASGGSFVLGLTLWMLPFPAWVGLAETSATEAKWVIWLAGTYSLVAMPAGLISSFYRTTGDFPRSQWMGNIQQVLLLSLVATVLVLGGGMRAVAAWQLLPLLAMTGFIMWDVRRKSPQLAPRVTKAKFQVFLSILRPSVLFGLLLVSNVLTVHGSVLVVSSVLGGMAVAVFVISRTLANLIRQVVGAMNSALWPDLTIMESSGALERLRRIHKLLVAGSSTLCIAIAAALWYEGAEIISAWTLGRIQPDVTLLRLLLVLLVLQTPWLASSVFTASASRHEKLAVSYMASSILGLAVAVVLVKSLGFWAIPIGLIIGEAAACYHFVVKDTCQMIGEPYSPFALRLWSGLIAVATIALLAGWAAHQLIPGPYLVRWLGVGAFTSIMSMAVAWSFWLLPEDRAQLVSRLRSSAVLLARV